jgi:hypothetical protein
LKISSKYIILKEIQQERKMTHTKNSIQHLIDTNDKALIRGLLVIYALQTESEKSAKITRESNGVGFSSFHADFGSSLAEQYKRKGYLSPNQIAALRKMMKRYVGQLVRVANGEIPNPLRPIKSQPNIVVEVAQEVLNHSDSSQADINRAKAVLAPMQW